MGREEEKRRRLVWLVCVCVSYVTSLVPSIHPPSCYNNYHTGSVGPAAMQLDAWRGILAALEAETAQTRQQPQQPQQSQQPEVRWIEQGIGW